MLSNVRSIVGFVTTRMESDAHLNILIELAENSYHPVKGKAVKFRIANALHKRADRLGHAKELNRK